MDPVVFFFNTRLMQEYWAVNAPESPVSVLDVEGSSAFKAAKKLLTWIEGKSYVMDNYHDVLCAGRARGAAPDCLDRDRQSHAKKMGNRVILAGRRVVC